MCGLRDSDRLIDIFFGICRYAETRVKILGCLCLVVYTHNLLEAFI